MNSKAIRKALRGERILMCTFDRTGAVYGLDNSVAVSKGLAAELTSPDRLQADLFLEASDDGLLPGFSQTWRERR